MTAALVLSATWNWYFFLFSKGKKTTIHRTSHSMLVKKSLLKIEMTSNGEHCLLNHIHSTHRRAQTHTQNDGNNNSQAY